jgi:hypothetical protein
LDQLVGHGVDPNGLETYIVDMNDGTTRGYDYVTSLQDANRANDSTPHDII